MQIEQLGPAWWTLVNLHIPNGVLTSDVQDQIKVFWRLRARPLPKAQPNLGQVVCSQMLQPLSAWMHQELREDWRFVRRPRAPLRPR